MHNGATVVALVGILNHGDKFAPLGFEADHVVTYDARMPMVASDVIEKTAGLLVDLTLRGSVTLIGSSMGGMLAAFIVKRWRWLTADGQLDRLRVVLEDVPNGVESMAAAFCNPAVGRIITSPIGHILRPLSQIKVGPKDQYIEIPPAHIQQEIAGRDMGDDDWRAYVKAEAIKGLSGFSGDAWLSWLRWMIQVGRNGSLAEACGALEGIDTAYIACMGDGNDVVKQPHALDWWVQHVAGLKVLRIEATHCGHLQQVLTFRSAFAQAMG